MPIDLDTILKSTEKEGDCLIWTKCLNTDGYPRMAVGANSNIKVHRLVWELSNQTSAKGLIVRHSCNNPKCINPDHLIIGNHYDNMQDRKLAGRYHGLSQKEVITIKDLYAQGKKVKAIAQLFSVSKNTIYYSLNHRKVGT